MYNIKAVSREEYRRLDNRVTSILQQRWPAKEISQWMRIQGQTAVRGLRHPAPPVPSHSTAGPASHRPRGAEPISVQRQPPYREGAHLVVIDQNNTILCAITALSNLGTAAQINPTYQPALHQLVVDHHQHEEALAQP